MGTLFDMMYVECFLVKLEARRVKCIHIISYGFGNNDDISTMSHIPKFAQLSSTYYSTLYYSKKTKFLRIS